MRVPSSTTRLAGSLKKLIALAEFLDISANNFSRHRAISFPNFGTKVCRERKYDVSIALNFESKGSAQFKCGGDIGLVFETIPNKNFVKFASD
jgi:hypothetical protein